MEIQLGQSLNCISYANKELKGKVEGEGVSKLKLIEIGPNQKDMGSKIFLWLCQVARQKILVSRYLDVQMLNINWIPKIQDKNQLYSTFAKK